MRFMIIPHMRIIWNSLYKSYLVLCRKQQALLVLAGGIGSHEHLQLQEMSHLISP